MRNFSALKIWLRVAGEVKGAMAKLLFRRWLPLSVLAAATIAAAIGLVTSLYMSIAALGYFLMLAGIAARRENRILHRRLMFAAMGMDLCLVILIEIQRSAMETLVALGLSPLQLGHVLASTLALALYLPVLLLGRKLWAKEDAGTRLWHKRLGITAFGLRTVGFLLMFSLLGRSG
jgi:hypothetical protein